MADEHATGGGVAAFHCPWCSATLPSTDLETCPSCGATLTSAPETAMPGITSIDHEAILRATREPTRPQRSRILSWLSGDYVEEGVTPVATPDAIAPPDAAVKREILRLEIEAELADRQAEADSIMADAAVEGLPIPGADEEPAIEDVEPAEGVGTESVLGDDVLEDEGAVEPGTTLDPVGPDTEADRRV
jgi:hypothetical protein